MPQFMLLLHQRTTDDAGMSPEEIQAVIRDYQAWSRTMAEAGHLLGGEKLTDDDGKILSGSMEDFSVTDGPLTEAKEVIGGFFHIEATDYDEAVTLAADCPHLKYGGRIELRQIESLA